jgi:hypothetical protein
MKFIVRTWAKGEQDFSEDSFETLAEADEYAAGSRLNGWEAAVKEQQPDLFEAAQ